MNENRIHPSWGCPQCLDVWGWNLLGACASVGIEHGKSTQQMASEFMAAYHARHDGVGTVGA